MEHASRQMARPRRSKNESLKQQDQFFQLEWMSLHLQGIDHPPERHDGSHFSRKEALSTWRRFQSDLDSARTALLASPPDPHPFHSCLDQYGPVALKILLADDDVLAEITHWWGWATWGDPEAKITLQQIILPISKCLTRGVPRKKDLAAFVREKEAIIENCNKWLPICQKLKKDFRRLWNDPAFTNEFKRKEVKEKLAKKFSILVANVNAIESYLYPNKELSRRGYKATPWNAMLRMVALKNSGSSLAVGVKTVEALYLQWLDAHPEKKKRQRKSVTTPFADEKTLLPE